MTGSFDPYHKWLSISPECRPASHYRLLGISDFEADAEVIQESADRQMAYIARYKSGEYAAVARQILVELKAAKDCLLNEEQKAAYDRTLRQTLRIRHAPPIAPPSVAAPTIAPPVDYPPATPAGRPVAGPPIVISPVRTPLAPAQSASEPILDVVGGPNLATRQRRTKTRQSSLLLPTLLALLVAICAAVYVHSRSSTSAHHTATKPGSTSEPFDKRPNQETDAVVEAGSRARSKTAQPTAVVPAKQPGPSAPPSVSGAQPPRPLTDAAPADRQTVSQPGEHSQIAAPTQKPRPAVKPITNSLGMRLEFIPAGQFLMGSPVTEAGRSMDEHQHEVVLTRPFYMSAYITTVSQFRQFVEAASYRPKESELWLKQDLEKSADQPAGNVSWEDATAFCEWLTQQESRVYRLPTEAEWEYCCRAGSQTAWFFGSDAAALPQYAWCGANSGGTTHPVGRLKPNAWGLFDMKGNQWQWTADWYAADYYQHSSKNDPVGPATGQFRILRGASCHADAGSCRSALRHGFHVPSWRRPHVGFRVMLEAPRAGEASD